MIGYFEIILVVNDIIENGMISNCRLINTIDKYVNQNVHLLFTL